MRMPIGKWKDGLAFVLVLAAIILSTSCSNVSFNYKHSEETTEKLAGNSFLKRSWPEAPIPIYISDKFPKEFKSHCIEAIDIWNFESGSAVFEYMGEVSSDTEAQDALNIIYWDENPHAKGYFGAAHTYWINDNVLIEGDVIIYGKVSSYAVLECPGREDSCRTNQTKTDFMSVILHELGHILGLGHSSSFGDVMYPQIYYGDVSRKFSTEMLAELTLVYNPEFVSAK